MLFSGNKTLNKNIPIPLYYQLKTILLEYIKEHHKNLEAPIPTEVEISEYFGISRPTVRQAINELVVEGYLYRIKAKGTFISKQKIAQDFLLILDSFNNELKKKGQKLSTKILEKELIKSDEKVSQALKISEGTDVTKLTRLKFADNDPLGLIISYVPYNICPSLLMRDLENESIYKFIEKESGLLITHAAGTLESILSDGSESKLLNIVRGSVLQYIESIISLENGTPVEYSIAKYRGDLSKFKFELKRQL